MTSRIALALALAGCTLVAACGGGGGGGGDTATPAADTAGVPASAQASVGGLVAYIQQLIAGNNETDQPVSLDNVTLPTDDTAEPAPI